MTHPLTPREKVAAFKEELERRCLMLGDAEYLSTYRAAMNEAYLLAEKMFGLTALASGSGDHSGGVTDMIGSGDHVELACKCVLGLQSIEDRICASDPFRFTDGTVYAKSIRVIEALLAENAALRGERDRNWEEYLAERQSRMEHGSREAGYLDQIERLNFRATEAECKLAEAVADERARGQVIINERDKWIVELIRERDAAKAILRNAVSEAIPDAMIFAGHADAQRYSKALDGLRIWTDRARTFLSKEAERG